LGAHPVKYVAAFAFLALGCAALPRLPARIADCDGPLLATEQIPGGDFRLRERVRIAGGRVDLGLELLAERRADRLVVVGFNEFGARVFSAVQRGLEVESESKLGRALAVPPENVLRDLHQARFFHPESGDRVVVRRPGCGYTATFVRVERRRLR
ncbi:MAG: DUF3261 domain-containing protein, partial [Myxococcota bacterium]